MTPSTFSFRFSSDSRTREPCVVPAWRVAPRRRRKAAEPRAVGELRRFGPDAVGEQGFGAGLARGEELARHVGVADIEFAHRHGPDAFLLQGVFEVLAAELAVVGRVGEDRHLPEPATLD